MGYTFSMDFGIVPPSSSLFVDLRTIHFMVALTFLIQAVVIGFHAKLIFRYRGIRMFLASALVLAAGSVVQVVLPALSTGSSGMITNAFMLWGAALQYGALMRFTGRHASRLLLWGLTGGGTAFLLLLLFWPTNFPFAFVREVLTLPLLFAAASAFWKVDVSTYRIGAYLTSLPFVGYGAFTVIRLVRAFINPAFLNPSLGNISVDAVILFASSFLWTSGFLLMLNQRMQGELTALATHDSMTGALNRRAMTDVLQVEHERFQRYGRPFTVILLDLDRFKVINDTRGHDVGDKVLIRTSQILAGALRAGDNLARWGGEEFLICLPETPESEGLALADRLRLMVAGHAFELEGVNVTFSAGVAGYRQGQSIDELCVRADRALYQAKETRNRVVALESS